MDDFGKLEEDEKALACLTMALSPDIAPRFLELKSAKAFWEALIEVYEGNEDMKESRKDMINQQLNMFMFKEKPWKIIQRFITLFNDMRTANIRLTNAEINKKLLNALPRSWDMNIDHIHPEDVKEMVIPWKITMAVFRAKNFAEMTRRDN
ncbi:uncharacterized protein LOC143601539 [Bidens hawaiensis]|uniref:uncharacterized protein LOC143601539 n=1 Tax=Bidens hawaiensis TaxID=980011 RepID=UPI00404B8491